MENVIAEIKKRMTSLLREKKQILVAIDGSCTAGKSTLADALAREYDCNLFHLDDFFLRPVQRTPERLAKPGGNVDYERFQEEVLLPLKQGVVFSYRPYDCSTGKLKEEVPVMPKRINVVEGSYSCHPYFRDPYDLKIFLDVCPEVRAKRILQRSQFLQKRFFEEWIPMEQQYFEEFSIREQADLVAIPFDNQ